MIQVDERIEVYLFVEEADLGKQRTYRKQFLIKMLTVQLNPAGRDVLPSDYCTHLHLSSILIASLLKHHATLN